ncbi:MAG: hypothetical protein ACE5EN_00845 [Nitrospinota bacterium]
MRNIREKLVFSAILALFITGAFFLLWRESAQINLKSGMKLYEANDPSALTVLENGIRKNRYEYLLYYGVARTLQKAGFADMSRDSRKKERLFDARRSINNAMALRFDGYGQTLLAFNYELTGEEQKALAHYNIAYFFSQKIDELKQWERLRPRQADTAKEYFIADATGVSLIMAYNALTGYGPRHTDSRRAGSTADNLLKAFFLSASPARWLTKDWPEGKGILKEKFEELDDADKESVARQFDEAGFGFLSHFLRSSA